jgi:hypothetical protein
MKTKTNMQAISSKNMGVLKTTEMIVSRHGILGLFRGVSAVAAGAGNILFSHYFT